MQALIFDRSKTKWETSRGFEKVEVPDPMIDEENNPEDANYIIMKVHYAGVCGSDKGIWFRQAFKEQILRSIDKENHPYLASPIKGEERKNIPSPRGGGLGRGGKFYRIIGHEFLGEIVDMGSHIASKFKLKKGDFVTCESHVVCNKCYQCVRGEKNVCTNEKILGISHDGGFAEYAKVPAHIIWKTDTSKIRPEVAVMQEPFGNAVHAASRVDLKGKSVAIFGLGPIGMFLTLIVKGMGASSIIGVEPNPVAQEMAKKLGIDYVIPLKPSQKEKPYQHDQEVTDEIMKIANGLGVDVSFEMAGFNSSVNNCLYATRRGGDIILFGIKSGDFVFEDYNRLIVRGYTLHCVIGRQVWKTWETTRKLLEDPSNKIQEEMFNIILNEGKGTILPIQDYTKEVFEEKMRQYPKILIQF